MYIIDGRKNFYRQDIIILHHRKAEGKTHTMRKQ